MEPNQIKSLPPLTAPLETEAIKTTMVTRTPTPPYEANVIVHHLEAWMPDIIATNKLRGFVQDNNGEVLESVPGKIKVRIGTEKARSALSWLGLGHHTSIVDVELLLDRNNPAQQNQLHITVLMSSPNRKPADAHWRKRCGEVFCELRSSLAGTVVAN